MLTELKLNAITDADLLFLEQVYFSTRVDELALTAWSDTEKIAFINQQFNAQHSHYQSHFPKASYDIIIHNDTAVGRLYIDRAPEAIRIIDIALLPHYRGKGLGSQILRNILAEADEQQLSVSIHVEKINPAMSLYKRLGFKFIEDQGVYDYLEYKGIHTCLN